jgi:hypothetical protein
MSKPFVDPRRPKKVKTSEPPARQQVEKKMRQVQIIDVDADEEMLTFIEENTQRVKGKKDDKEKKDKKKKDDEEDDEDEEKKEKKDKDKDDEKKKKKKDKDKKKDKNKVKNDDDDEEDDVQDEDDVEDEDDDHVVEDDEIVVVGPTGPVAAPVARGKTEEIGLYITALMYAAARFARNDAVSELDLSLGGDDEDEKDYTSRAKNIYQELMLMPQQLLNHFPVRTLDPFKIERQTIEDILSGK